MTDEPTQERRAAHERLSTGALARWMRAFATHPWRVVLAWVGIIAVLIVLVSTIGGSLEGRVRDPGLGHPEGDRPDRVRVRRGAGWHPEPRLRGTRGRAPRHSRAACCDRRGGRRAQDRRVRPDRHGSRRRGRHHERRRPLRREHVLGRRTHRLRRGAVRPHHLRGGPRTGPGRAGCRARGGRARRRHRGVQRRRGVPADRAGHAGAARPARGADRAPGRVPDLHRRRDPDLPGADRPRDRVHPAVHPRGADGDQHDHAAARVDDRTRRRHRLLAVHRHALPAAPARGALPDGRRGRGRRVRGPGDALRRAHGRDLGDGARLLRAGLRDEARHRLRARGADDGADRQLVADRRAREARAQGRPAQGAVPAPARRLRCRTGEDADRALGPLRNPEPQAGLRRPPARGLVLATSSGLVRLGASDQGTQPTEQTARRAYDLLRRASAPASTGRSRSSST